MSEEEEAVLIVLKKITQFPIANMDRKFTVIAVADLGISRISVRNYKDRKEAMMPEPLLSSPIKEQQISLTGIKNLKATVGLDITDKIS